MSDSLWHHCAFMRLWFARRGEVVLGAISLDLFAVLLGGTTALLPMFAKDVLHVDPWGLFLLRAVPAVGPLRMALTLSCWPLHRNAGRVLLGGVGSIAIAALWMRWFPALASRDRLVERQ